MKKQWDNLFDNLSEFQEQLETFLSDADLKPTDSKNALALTKMWAQITNMANDFDQFVTPVESLTVEEFKDKNLKEAWSFYKDYLTEQFGIVMRSRYEKKSIELLKKYSDNDNDAAVNILNICTGNGYQRFFKINNKDDKTKKSIDHDPDFK